MSPFLYLDIETLPTNDEAVIQSIAQSITPPGNISKPETIAAWERDKKPSLIAEAISKTALSGQHGRVCCLGWAWNDAEPWALIDVDESCLLIRAFATIENQMPMWGAPVIVGHCIAQFDIRFIWQRAFALGVTIPGWFPRNARPWDNLVFDTMTAWAGARDMISLDNLAKALGIPGKGEVTGSDVAELWRQGNVEAIAAYCKADIELTRDVHRKMRVAYGEAA